MPAMAQVPKDHPLMLAWEAHKQTERYANSKKWAAHPQHVDGSLWALFEAGWRAAHLTQPAQAVDDDTLLDVARRVGLRQQLTGINSDDAKFLLRAFVAALPNANGKEG